MNTQTMNDFRAGIDRLDTLTPALRATATALDTLLGMQAKHRIHHCTIDIDGLTYQLDPNDKLIAKLLQGRINQGRKAVLDRLHDHVDNLKHLIGEVL